MPALGARMVRVDVSLFGLMVAGLIVVWRLFVPIAVRYTVPMKEAVGLTEIVAVVVVSAIVVSSVGDAEIVKSGPWSIRMVPYMYGKG